MANIHIKLFLTSVLQQKNANLNYIEVSNNTPNSMAIY